MAALLYSIGTDMHVFVQVLLLIVSTVEPLIMADTLILNREVFPLFRDSIKRERERERDQVIVHGCCHLSMVVCVWYKPMHTV